MTTFTASDGFPDSECQMILAAVVALAGHGQPAADADVACVHEHVTRNVPVCDACLARHAADPLCCRECEMGFRLVATRRQHCCAVTVVVRSRAGVS